MTKGYINRMEKFLKGILLHKSIISIAGIVFIRKHRDILVNKLGFDDVDIIDLLVNLIRHDVTKSWIDIYMRYASIDEKEKLQGVIMHMKEEQHHPEWWDDDFPEEYQFSQYDMLDIDKPIDATSMLPLYILEMVLDWFAVSIEKGTSLREWYEKTKNKRWKWTEEQEWLIEQLIGLCDDIRPDIEKIIGCVKFVLPLIEQ